MKLKDVPINSIVKIKQANGNVLRAKYLGVDDEGMPIVAFDKRGRSKADYSFKLSQREIDRYKLTKKYTYGRYYASQQEVELFSNQANHFSFLLACIGVGASLAAVNKNVIQNTNRFTETI